MSGAPSPDILELFCPTCAYNLRGLTTDRCPECGQAFDRATLSNSPIPWMHRLRIGRSGAFCRTIWQATFHPPQLAAAMAAPLPIRDALRFWAIAVAGLYVITAWPLIWLSIDFGNIPDWGLDFQLPIVAGTELRPLLFLYWLALPCAVSLIQCLTMARAAGNAATRQRAAAVGLYLTGALLLILLVTSIIVDGIVSIWIAGGDELARHIPFLLTVPLCVAMLLRLIPTSGVYRHIARTSHLRTLLVALRLLLLWCVGALVCCIGLPWVAGLLRIMFHSIR